MPDQTDAVASPAAEGGAPNPESTQTTTVAVPPSRESRIQTMVREMATRGAPPKPPEASPPAESPAAEPEGAPVLSETPPAAAEAAQPGSEKPPEQAAEHESETVPVDIRKAIGRIRQLKDQRKALKAELGDKDATVAALTAQVEALQAQVDRVQAKPATPSFENVEDPQVIESEVSQASKVVEWAEDRLDSFDGEADTEVLGAELESQGVKAPPSGWTPKAVRQTLVTIRNNARTTAKAGSDRKQWLSIESQALEYVAKSVPQLQSDPAFAGEVSALLESRPVLKSMPEWPVASVALVLGMRALRAGPAKPAAPPAAVPSATPPRPPAVAGAPRATVPVPVDQVEELRRRAVAPGASREDRVALLKAQLLKSKG